jgi:hypothetical protein
MSLSKDFVLGVTRRIIPCGRITSMSNGTSFLHLMTRDSCEMISLSYLIDDVDKPHTRSMPKEKWEGRNLEPFSQQGTLSLSHGHLPIFT